MKPFVFFATWLAVAGVAAAQGAKPIKKCPTDSVVSGAVCMDKYEATVWRIPGATTSNKAIVLKVQQGKATAAALKAAGATQLVLGLAQEYEPCHKNGQNCANDVYALSLPGEIPSRHMTWFQAQAACKNARKRLPSNAEWQAAVAGTPDTGSDNGTSDCHTGFVGGLVTPTGSRSDCVSDDGAFDMIGNVPEWVADWVPRSKIGCGGSWNATDDIQCLVGAETDGEPGALVRGGAAGSFSNAGPLWIDGTTSPAFWPDRGFRCAR
jgi:formylglycine-generating enzyme required for sulfatase activity